MLFKCRNILAKGGHTNNARIYDLSSRVWWWWCLLCHLYFSLFLDVMSYTIIKAAATPTKTEMTNRVTTSGTWQQKVQSKEIKEQHETEKNMSTQLIFHGRRLFILEGEVCNFSTISVTQWLNDSLQTRFLFHHWREKYITFILI